MEKTNHQEVNPNIIPFESSEEIWFWYCRGQHMRNIGNRQIKRISNTIERPCYLDDIMRIVMKLRFAGKIKQKHLDVIHSYGNRFSIPDVRDSKEREDAKLWQFAFNLLEITFRKKGFLSEKRKFS
ncbi:MAG: hypothetical protein ACTSXV_00650 [Alphaproteobacteria bacterium]